MVHGIILVQLSRPTVFFTPSLRVFFLKVPQSVTMVRTNQTPLKSNLKCIPKHRIHQDA